MNGHDYFDCTCPRCQDGMDPDLARQMDTDAALILAAIHNPSLLKEAS